MCSTLTRSAQVGRDCNGLTHSVAFTIFARHEPCTDVISDTRFHPLGVAKAFYTAHHAVLPDTEYGTTFLFWGFWGDHFS